MRRQTGAVSALLLLSLPALLAALSLVVDVAVMVSTHGAARAAADMAALAACQELDLEALAGGNCRLDAGRAVQVARELALRNLSASLGEEAALSAAVTAEAHNPSPDSPARDRVTGRELTVPTVCVTVRVRTPALFLAAVLGRPEVKVHADASVVARGR